MIYLDHHAATPVVDSARLAMEQARASAWANPSSAHAPGRAARAILEEARRRVAGAVKVAPSQIVFTAGGSEACQTAIEGLAAGASRIVTTSIEHPAVSESLARRAARGIVVMPIVVSDEPVDPGRVVELVEPGSLVVVQWVNHEVGAILPVEALGRICRERGARLVVDASQAFGKLPLDLGGLGASAVALASAKIGGPAGAGALVLAPGEELEPLLVGGAQERGRRAGTPNIEALAGFGGAALDLDSRLGAMPAVAARRDRLEAGLVALGASVNAADHPRVATCSSVSFRGRRATVLAAALDLEGIAVSTGPACSSGLDRPSPTVLAMYPDEPERAGSMLRFSLGPSTTDAEVSGALDAVGRVLARSIPR